MKRPAVLIFNPRSGRQQAERLVPRLVRLLSAGGYDLEALATNAPGHATELARRAVEERAPEVVFGLGGDGTLREVAAGLIGTGVALGTLPAGTTNVLPTALGLSRDPLAVAQTLTTCRPRDFDVGMAGEVPFLMMLSCGFDAAVMAGQQMELKRLFGRSAIAFDVMRRFSSYLLPQIEMRVDGLAERASFVALCNIPLYAGSFRLAPDAADDDGRLDMILFRGRSRTALAGLMRDLLIGWHVRRSDVVYVPVEEVELLGPADLDVQIDGDVIAVEWPLTVRVVPGGLRVLAPG